MALRCTWTQRVQVLKRMRQWILEAEEILAGAWGSDTEPVTNARVGARFDAWVQRLREEHTPGDLPADEQRCLGHLLHITASVRARLIQCYDHPGIPRTNNDLEDYIRGVKTRYRRISGWKNWNRYLLRHGRCVVYYDWLERRGCSAEEISTRLMQVRHDQWRCTRAEHWTARGEQRMLYRFRQNRATYLHTLESAWAATGGM